ncbi:MAG: hypothetical protein RIE53_10275 [Rhodothermales bacterium]
MELPDDWHFSLPEDVEPQSFAFQLPAYPLFADRKSSFAATLPTIVTDHLPQYDGDDWYDRHERLADGISTNIAERITALVGYRDQLKRRLLTLLKSDRKILAEIRRLLVVIAQQCTEASKEKEQQDQLSQFWHHLNHSYSSVVPSEDRERDTRSMLSLFHPSGLLDRQIRGVLYHLETRSTFFRTRRFAKIVTDYTDVEERITFELHGSTAILERPNANPDVVRSEYSISDLRDILQSRDGFFVYLENVLFQKYVTWADKYDGYVKLCESSDVRVRYGGVQSLKSSHHRWAKERRSKRRLQNK